MISIEELSSHELPFVRSDQEGIVEEINDRFISI
jgi:hypothetical protein